MFSLSTDWQLKGEENATKDFKVMKRIRPSYLSRQNFTVLNAVDWRPRHENKMKERWRGLPQYAIA